jgi:hypothetical protein
MPGAILTPDEVLAGTGITGDALANVTAGSAAATMPYAPAPAPVGPPLPPGAAPAPGTPAAPTAVSGRMIRAVNPKGETVDVPAENWQKALELGFKEETPEQTAVREYLAENRGTSGAAKAGLLSFANQALMGIPEIVYEKTGDPLEVAKHQALQKEHALAAGVGGVAGFGASLFVGGPVFKGAGVAARGVESAVLSGTEKLVAARLAAHGVTEGAAETVAKSLVARSVAGAAKLGTEAAVVALPTAVTEAALGDPHEAAETILFSLGAGAALGALAPGATDLFARATKGTLMAPKSAGAVLETYANEQAIKSHAPYKRISDRLAEIPGGEQAAGKIIREKGLVRQVGEDAESLHERVGAAKEEAGAAIGATYTKLDDAGVVFDAKEIADGLRKHVLTPLEGKVGFEGRAKKVAGYIDSFVDRTGATPPPEPELLAAPKFKAPAAVSEKELLAELEAKHAGSFGTTSPAGGALEHVKWGDVDRDFFLLEKEGGTLPELVERRNAEQLAQHQEAHLAEVARVGEENAARKARWAESVATPRDLRPSELQQIKGDLQTLIYGESLPAPEQVDEYFKQVRDAFKGHLDTAVEQHLGAGERLALDKANLDYRVLSILEKGSKANIGRELTNRGSSLTDYVLGVAGAHIGGPAGTLVGMLGNKWLRANWNTLNVYGAEKLGVLVGEQAMRRAAEQIDRVPEVLKALATGSRRAASSAPSRALAELTGHEGADTDEVAFEKARDWLTQAMVDRDGTTRKVGELAGGFAAAGAPEIASAYTEAQHRVLAHLFQTMPRPERPPAPFTKDRWKPSRVERDAWLRRVAVARHGVDEVLNRLEDGTLGKDHLETFDVVAPKLAARLRQKLLEVSQEPDAPELPLATRGAVASLMGGPLGAAGSVGGIGRWQAHFAQEKAAEAGRRGGSPKLPELGTEVGRVSG